MTANDPHRDEPILHGGCELAAAQGAVVLLHGRGASAEDILQLAPEFQRNDFAFLAPQAADGTWYPYSFLVSVERNEPYLTSALSSVFRSLEKAITAGIPKNRLVVGGFSQGACLAAEFFARSGNGMGGFIAFTGGVIGHKIQPDRYSADLRGTFGYMGSGDPDPHVPWERVEESAALLTKLGCDVQSKRFQGMPHTISREEINAAKELLSRVMGR